MDSGHRVDSFARVTLDGLEESRDDLPSRQRHAGTEISSDSYTTVLTQPLARIVAELEQPGIGHPVTT